MSTLLRTCGVILFLIGIGSSIYLYNTMAVMEVPAFDGSVLTYRNGTWALISLLSVYQSAVVCLTLFVIADIRDSSLQHQRALSHLRRDVVRIS